MTRKREKLLALCCGNIDAVSLLELWQPYVNTIDDIEDGDIVASEDRMPVYIQALEFYTHPFFVRHMAQLKLVIVNCQNDYADSIAWEHSSEEWQRQEADVLRHSGSALVRAVAYICAEEAQPGSGYAHLRSFSLVMREICYNEHHDAEGKPC